MAESAQVRRETVVPDNAIYAALSAIAAVIEEPYCVVGARELRQLVHVHSRLYRALDGKPHGQVDYAWRDGAAVSARDPAQVIKRPVWVEGLSNEDAAVLVASQDDGPA